MDIDNGDTKNLIGVIVILILIILVIVLTVFATNKRVNSTENTPVVKKINAEETKTVTEKELSKLNDGFLRVLYDYSLVGGDLKTYLTGLDNNQKLYLGDIMRVKKDSINITISDVKNTLINILGNDIGVTGTDYYITTEDIPFLLYNETSGSYKINPEYTPIPEIVTNLSNKRIYNYKVKNIEVINNQSVITVYGLYKNSDGITEYLENDKELKRYIDVEEQLEEYGYTEDDETFLNNMFENDISQFIEFKYTYEYQNNGFNLVDFTVVQQ